jgi:hypothetical protein
MPSVGPSRHRRVVCRTEKRTVLTRMTTRQSFTVPGVTQEPRDWGPARLSSKEILRRDPAKGSSKVFALTAHDRRNRHVAQSPHTARPEPASSPISRRTRELAAVSATGRGASGPRPLEGQECHRSVAARSSPVSHTSSSRLSAPGSPPRGRGPAWDANRRLERRCPERGVSVRLRPRVPKGRSQCRPHPSPRLHAKKRPNPSSTGPSRKPTAPQDGAPGRAAPSTAC